MELGNEESSEGLMLFKPLDPAMPEANTRYEVFSCSELMTCSGLCLFKPVCGEFSSLAARILLFSKCGSPDRQHQLTCELAFNPYFPHVSSTFTSLRPRSRDPLLKPS